MRHTLTTVLFLAAFTGPCLAQATITDLGTLWDPASVYALAMSADGSTVAGYATPATGLTGFVWTQATGMQSMGLSYIPSALSHNGTVAVGAYQPPLSPSAPFAWARVGGTHLLSMPAGYWSGSADGVSADGHVVVGSGNPGDSVRGLYWTLPDTVGVITAPGLPLAFFAKRTNADGSLVAGSEYVNSGYFRVYRTHPGVDSQPIGEAGPAISYVDGMSEDGAVMVGRRGSPGGAPLAAYRWTQAAGMQSLDADTVTKKFTPQSVSADGAIIAGDITVSAASHAAVWTATRGAQDLNTLLPSLGVDLTGWTLERAFGVTADGTTIAGSGNHGGWPRAWIVRGLPPIALADCAAADVGRQGGFTGADYMLDNNDFVAFIALFFNSDSKADMGRQGGLRGSDGLLDNNDFIVFIDRFFTCF